MFQWVDDGEQWQIVAADGGKSWRQTMAAGGSSGGGRVLDGACEG